MVKKALAFIILAYHIANNEKRNWLQVSASKLLENSGNIKMQN